MIWLVFPSFSSILEKISYLDHVYMIAVVACPGWWLGLSGMVTLSARVAMCYVNVSRRVTRLTRVAFMLQARQKPHPGKNCS